MRDIVKVLGWGGIGVGIVIGIGGNILNFWQIALLGIPSYGWTAIAFALFSAGLISLVLEFRKELQIKKVDRDEELVKTIPSIGNSQITALSESHPKSSEVASEGVITLPDNRIVVDVTPEYLQSFFNEYTDIQAKKLAASYIGKWIKISGPLNDISAFSGYASQVTFADRSLSSSKASVYMYFKEEWVDRLSVLKRNDHIIVLGKISDISRAKIDLENCELVTR